MKGTVRCARCQKKRVSGGTCECGAYTCYAVIFWKGKQHKYWRSATDSQELDYGRAHKLLITMEPSIVDGTFNPIDWTPKASRERRLDHQAFAWTDDMIEQCEKGDRSFEYLKNLKGYRDNYFIPLLGQKDVRKIQFEDLCEFRDSLPATLSSKTRRNILNALHGLFEWMRSSRVVTVIPVFPEIKCEATDPRPFLTTEQQLEGLDKLPDCHRNVFEFGFETGMRSGELCALQIRDINLKTGEAIIRRTWSGARLVERTKGKNKLPIPLSDRAIEIARAEIQARGSMISLDAFLFINSDTGNAYRQKALNNLWHDHSGFDMVMHDACRRSFCSQMAELEGVNLAEMQRLMRHADVRTTLNYVTLSTSRLKGIVNRRSQSASIGTNRNGTTNDKN